MLVDMADGRQNAEWERASLLAALLFNAHRGKARPKKPNDLNPFAKRMAAKRRAARRRSKES